MTPAALVSAAPNCSVVASESWFALTRTSEILTMFSIFLVAFSDSSPSAAWEPARSDVARERSNAPACANLITAGSASIDLAAERPADPRKKYACASSRAAKVDSSDIWRATASISRRS